MELKKLKTSPSDFRPVLATLEYVSKIFQENICFVISKERLKILQVGNGEMLEFGIQDSKLKYQTQKPKQNIICKAKINNRVTFGNLSIA